MPVEGAADGRLAAPLACRVGDNATAAQVAAAMVAIWQEIDEALAPILGQGGVAALHNRAFYATGKAHPWLAAGREDLSTGMDLVTLKSILAQQSSAAAAAAGSDFLQTFEKLLTSLIGLALTEALLRPVWVKTSSGAPAEDTSP